MWACVKYMQIGLHTFTCRQLSAYTHSHANIYYPHFSCSMHVMGTYNHIYCPYIKTSHLSIFGFECELVYKIIAFIVINCF